ncbi:hypothetical protein [Streptomyces sp. Ncost-T10-10d]|uniref:hypothetical protein n=1 Tax=Streptomyces sp. Ncost-T10-10d TaxID=1839774 RepID=UPI00081E20D6|nr:hypothetical protein [Streptomyces sp. Ncost-T10-10d]SCF56461.1 hypothetical protein GA0115254_10063 [Streptomyces sp. Ncost-T10-10d]
MTARTVDAAPLAGGWVNFDTTATGIHLVDAAVDGSRLMLRITERGDPDPSQETLVPTAPVTGATLPAVPLADDMDTPEAVAFLAEGPLGSRQVILCGYLNRGLLTIDVHTVHTVDPQIPNVMYRAHFYRSEGAVSL